MKEEKNYYSDEMYDLLFEAGREYNRGGFLFLTRWIKNCELSLSPKEISSVLNFKNSLEKIPYSASTRLWGFDRYSLNYFLEKMNEFV